MGTVEIIELAPEDWEQFRTLRLEALRLEPQAFGSTYADQVNQPPDFWEGRLRKVLASDNDGLRFACLDQRLVGMIGWFREPRASSAIIVGTYVSRFARGSGVATALLDAILQDLCARDGIDTATLTVNRAQTAAVALYEKFGFSISAETNELLGDGKHHATLQMQKQLADR